MSLGRLLGLRPDPILSGPHIFLRPPKTSDYGQWSKLRAESHDFLQPWEPVWPEDDLTRSAFRLRVSLSDRDRARAEAYTFFIFSQSDATLLGGLTLGYLRYGAAQTATLGYWMGERFAGQGYMRQGVELALDYAFLRLGLHRVEAACLPRNDRSVHLLRHVGFQEEGLARAFLEINGRWEDHLLFAILETDWRSHTKA